MGDRRGACETRAAATVAALVLLALVFLVCTPRLSLAEDASGAAYSDAEAVENAKTLIAALPADPDAITEADRAAIEAATSAYDALSESDRAALDSEIIDKEQSYGRWLESAQWGLAAKTETIDDSTTLEDGDYSAYISSSSDMGKSTSERARSWSASKLVVSDGKFSCTIRCDGTSAFKNLRIAGVDYAATSDDGVPEFTVPMQVNENLKFTVDASSIADSIAYEIEVRLDVSNASSTEVAYAKELAGSALSGVKASWTPASKKSVRAAARALSRVAAKAEVKRVELELFQAQLTAAQGAAKEKGAGKAAAGKKATSKTAAGEKTAGSGSAAKAGGSGSGSGSGSSSDSGATASGSDSGASSSSGSASSTSSASPSKDAAKSGGAKKARGTEVTPVAEGSTAAAAGAGGQSDDDGSSASAEPSYPLLMGLVAVLLFLAGMVLRTVSFNRQMEGRRGR